MFSNSNVSSSRNPAGRSGPLPRISSAARVNRPGMLALKRTPGFGNKEETLAAASTHTGLYF